MTGFKRGIIYFLFVALMSVSIYGCNNNDANANNDAAKENADNADNNTNESTEPDNVNETGQADTPTDEQAASGASVEPVNTPIAERSPVEITRIEVPEEQTTDDVADKSTEPEEHEVTPERFPVDKCQVEVNGIYQVKLAKDLLKEVNKRRADRKLSALNENQSLQACADARCKEQTYFIGHFRPDGSAFDSVGRGYVQGECIAVEYRSVTDIMEAWFAVNESRYQIMNPDYTQCGISIYDIDGTYYIAAEFGY